VATYTFYGYNFTDYVPVSGGPAVGATFRIRPTFNATTDKITFTVTDDDPTLSGSSTSSLDATQQTAVVTSGNGSTLYSGTIHVGWEATFTAPDGSTLHVWDVYKADGTRIGLIADGEIPPGVTFQITTYVEASVSGSWPLYTAIHTPTTNPDLANTISGGTLADSLYGGAGNDSLSGGTGNDTLDGSTGSDTLEGGAGNDSLLGGADRDRFIFHDGFGADTVNGSSLAGSTQDDDSMDFAALSGAITVTFTGTEAGTVTHGADTVSFTEIESVEGTNYADSMNASADAWGVYLGGDLGNDTITGGSGADTIEGGGDNDTLQGGSGNDWISGDAGTDTVNGGIGNDTVLGGAGGDSLYGGVGNDSLSGGTGNDQIWGDDGADTLTGGAGDDNLTGGAGNDLFVIGDADDYDNIDGGTETDSVQFSTTTSGQGVSVTYTGTNSGTYDFNGSTANGVFNNIEQITGTDFADAFTATAAGAGVSLDGSGGADTATGSSYADSLAGGAGNDSLNGGAGADTLSGGDGNDTLIGGLGDDSLTSGTGFDEIILGAGGGIDTLSGFDFTLSGARTADQLDTSGLLAPGGGIVTARSVQVQLDASGTPVLIFPSGERLVLQGASLSSVNTPGKLHAMGLPCYVAGSLIATPEGPRRVEEIAVGDLVMTRERGPQPVLWRASRMVSALDMATRPALRPIEIRAGAFGNARPLRVSAQHGVMLGGALVRAAHLAEAAPDLARVLRGRPRVHYHHLLLPGHALLCAEEIWAESLWPGPMAYAALDTQTRLGLLLQFPALAPGLLGLAPVEAAYGPRVRPLLRRREVAGRLLRA